MRRMQRKILELLLSERDRWVLWTPVFFGLGIGIYFALGFEPNRNTLMGICTVIFAAIVLFRRAAFLPMLVVFALVSAGALTASFRTESVAAPALREAIPFAVVEGKIDEIVPREKDTRLVLSQVRFERLPAEETPAKVSVILRGLNHADALHQGDTIRVKAGFFPPPLPAYPDGYQFNRHYYFQGIGATGYSFGTAPPEVLKAAQQETGAAAMLAQIRQRILTQFLQEMGAEAGSVAAALTMGEQRAIPEHVFDAMRDSGLAHILSISGLHMALAAGIFFVSTRFLLTLAPSFALRVNTKKLAACAALLGAFVYLLLSGMPIPAQRSYLMIALVLLAVAFDRQVTPMRSLALAAMLVLIFIPESVLNPSFQLSFAATAGLVAYYEFWRERRGRNTEEIPKKRRAFLRYWLDIVATSAIATVATMPFILHHFAGFPIYSVLGNLLTLTLVSFWIMPIIVLLLLLLPFGLEGWLILPLKYGVIGMIRIGEWVASLPNAVVDIPPLSVGWLAVCALGGLWLCLWRGRWRDVGWIGVIAGFISLLFYQPPDVLLSEDGKKIAVRSGEDGMWMLRGRPEGFQQEQWLRFARVASFEKAPKQPVDGALACDAHGCRYAWAAETLSFVYDREALQEDCAESDLIIVPEWSVYGNPRKRCEAKILDRRWLLNAGGAAIRMTDEGMHIRTVRDATGQRPWSRGLISRR